VPGTTVAGVDISGMDEATALATVKAAFGQPIVIRIDKRVFRVTGTHIGASYGIDNAVRDAMARTVAGNTPVQVTLNDAKIDKAVSRIVRLTSATGRDPVWIIAPKPKISKPKPGKTASARIIRQQIARAAVLPGLRAEQNVIPLVNVGGTATLTKLGYVVTISKSQRVLRLWAPVMGNSRMGRSYRVAVGAPKYPTPSGRFTLVNKQVNPWWYPPNSEWAKDEKPVPPGPTNPLGTRWMGLDRQDIGIHGTPDAGSIGGYVSHGCIRMLIGSAEELYRMIGIGTPVLIY
jgi:lipoprotein-anchoring transpeptidase ErfK/SrfK